MRALVFRGPWDIGVEERPDPVAGPGEVLIEVIATGICGSDIHGYTGENGRRFPGQVMGHETVGRVTELGPGVSGPPTGSLVTVEPVLACGSCPACQAGNDHRCPNRRVIGVDPAISAAFADLMAVPAGNVVRLAESMPAEYGALVEPLAVGYHAAVRGGCGAGDALLVVGGGPIGQACVLAARRTGVSGVVVSEPDPGRRELLHDLGAPTVDPGAGQVADAVRGVLGRPATVVLDAVGSSRSLADALAASETGGRVVLVGMHEPTVSIPAYAVSIGERSVIGSYCYPAREFLDTAAWIAGADGGGDDVPNLERLIEDRVDWSGAAPAFRDLANGDRSASKVLVFPNGHEAARALVV